MHSREHLGGNVIITIAGLQGMDLNNTENSIPINWGFPLIMCVCVSSIVLQKVVKSVCQKKNLDSSHYVAMHSAQGKLFPCQPEMIVGDLKVLDIHLMLKGTGSGGSSGGGHGTGEKEEQVC